MTGNPDSKFNIFGILVSVMMYSAYPFVYFSMYIDFTERTMHGYWLMLIGTIFIAFVTSILSNNLMITIITVIVGNMLSFIMSYKFIHKMDTTTDWGYFFAPLETYQLLILVSILILIPQFLVIKLAYNKKKKASNVDS